LASKLKEKKKQLLSQTLQSKWSIQKHNAKINAEMGKDAGKVQYPQSKHEAGLKVRA
jgi:hypothetical protein